MRRPRQSGLAIAGLVFAASLLTACINLVPKWPAGIDCEEIQGVSLRALLGTDASSLETLNLAIRAKFPDSVPSLFGRRPLEQIPEVKPLFDFTVQWATPRREYSAFVEDSIVDSVAFTPAANYAGPTVQETIDCLGAPDEYFAATGSDPKDPRNVLDLRLLYRETPMVVVASRWENEMRLDGQLANPAIAAEAHVNQVAYFLPRRYVEWIDRVFWMRESDWSAETPQEIKWRDDFRNSVYATIQPWPESWDEIRVRPQNWQEQ